MKKILRKEYPRIRVVTKGTWIRYEVDCRSSLWGGKPRFTFEKKEEAITKAQEVADLVKNHGKSGFTRNDVRTLDNIKKKLLPYGLEPEEAIDRFINILINEDTVSKSANLKDVTDKYLIFKKSGLRDLNRHTVKQIGTVNRYLLSIFGNVPIGSITKDIAYKGIESMDVSNNSKKAYQKLFASFFKFAIKHKYIIDNPCADIHINTVKPLIVILDNKQIFQMLGRCINLQPKMIPYMAISLFSAIRPEELKKITWENVDLKTNHIMISAKVSKVKTERIVPISENLNKWLVEFKKYPINPRNFNNLFVDVKGDIVWVRDIARHTCISHLLAKTKNINEVAEYAGNSPEIIRSNYKRAVLPDNNEVFWNITPSSVRSYLVNGKVDQSALEKFTED